MFLRSPNARGTFDGLRNGLLVRAGLFVVVLGASIFTVRAEDAAPAAKEATPAEKTQPAAQESKAGDASKADAEIEFTFRVVTKDGQPVADASVRPWGVGVGMGSFGLPDKGFDAVKTDADGKAHIVFPKPGDDSEQPHLKNLHKKDVRSVALEVQHPDHPRWSGYLPVLGDPKIVLVDSTTIEIRARGHNDAAIVDRLYPVLRGPAADWSMIDGKLIVKRVDLAGEHPSRWLRIVHVPEKGPAWFSELIDLKQYTEKTISLDLRLKPGVRVVGRLADDVPRPVKNGQVVAEVNHGGDFWSNWHWYAQTEIDADGTFAFDVLPPDENLQMIGVCDGWISRSPTADEASEYATRNHWEELAKNALNSPTFVYPQLHRLEGLVNHPVLPMNPTASCEVTVLDEQKQPIPDAEVSFWPNQCFFSSGSNVVGTGADSLKQIRNELATGKKEQPDFTTYRNQYSVKTDANGKATVFNLPAGLAGEAAREEWFVVQREGYVAIANDPGGRVAFMSTDPELVAKLTPGETQHVTIQMKKRPATAPPATEGREK